MSPELETYFRLKVKALLHCIIFRASCLATPFSLQTFSHYETSCFTGVTLSNVSCNLSRFDDHMKSLAGAANRCDTSCRTDVTLRNARFNRCGK